ncbi:Stk1 family PASTA domain-containing Ser/Thr kinase [Corynebacterium sp. H127]|uniref:Stk1 family PASTA domain-containing Ser/Thr kinase n=1 Tax=Corynebacterium sp. H127 TaxID=3133418 RepID=UPI00309F0B7A
MSNVMVGDILDGRYRVETQIAKGGMSTVYRCVDMRLSRPVAAKVMDERYLDDPVFRSRFEREAKSMAQLNHPNLVNVYDFNSTGDHAFLVMELITGGTLRELLAERGPMPPHAATQVMRGVLTGLTAAHQKGLVHRDIKPDNVLINSDHRVKLADFGLVRAVSSSDRTSDSIVGTVSYLSPEQVSGAQIGPASDVYSAGVLLFELLTGTTPFDGDTQLAHAMRRLNQDVPLPSSRIDGVPSLFDELVVAATHRSPAERFATAADFLAALEDVATELELPSFKVPVPTDTAASRATEIVSPLPAAQPLAPDTAHSTSILPPYQEPEPVAPETAAFPVAATPMERAPLPTPLPPRGLEMRDQQPPDIAFEESQPVSNRSPIKLIAWLLVVALLISAVAVGGWWFGSGRYGEIPQILGMEQAAAVAAVSEAGFDPVIADSYSDDVPVGKAVGTEPPFGQRVPRSDQVTVLISQGQPTVPALPIGGDIAEYRRSVEERTLKLEIGDDVYSESVPVGAIAQVSPAAGVSVRTGSTITASLSKGAAPIPVPDVAGRELDTARAMLEQAGLHVGSISEDYSPQHAQGHVISSSPGASSKLAKGSAVDLKVSNALQVPDLEGTSLDKVQSELAAAGFIVTVERSNAAGDVPNEIVGVSRKAGDLVDPASAELKVTVASKIKVASVTGKTVQEATAILGAQGLGVSVNRSGDRVIRQSPRAGSKVEPRTSIELTTI